MSDMMPPIAHVQAITLGELNDALRRWEHKMGPWRRPTFRGWFHGLFHNGQLVAVTAAGDLIRERVAGFERAQAIELARLCAATPALCRPMLRLWREFVFPALCAVHGWSWAVSYQDAVLHTGGLYRHDGWVRVGRSRSGTDARSGARGRSKVIWGWSADESERRAREIGRVS